MWTFWFYSIIAGAYNMTPMVCLFWMSLRPGHLEGAGGEVVVTTTTQEAQQNIDYSQQQTAPQQQYSYQQPQTQQPGYAPLNGEPNYQN